MNKNVLMILHISSLTNENDRTVEKRGKRKQQHIEGLNKLFEHSQLYIDRHVDIVLIDNTRDDIDPDLEQLLPSNAYMYNYNGNVYGKTNKGSGLIESWFNMQHIIESYKYILYFEPRTLLINHDFIDTYTLNPTNAFKMVTIDAKTNCYVTTLFCIESNLLLEFISAYTAKHLSNNRISIEYCIYDFLKLKNANVIHVDMLNLIRYDYFANNIMIR